MDLHASIEIVAGCQLEGHVVGKEVSNSIASAGMLREVSACDASLAGSSSARCLISSLEKDNVPPLIGHFRYFLDWPED
jgi:hypothetical protein